MKFSEIEVSGIYSIYCTISRKGYIGSSKHVRNRLYTHYRQLLAGIHGNAHLQNAFNKYGEGAFELNILEENVPVDELFDTEQMYLDLVDSDYSLNICTEAGKGPGRTPKERIVPEMSPVDFSLLGCVVEELELGRFIPVGNMQAFGQYIRTIDGANVIDCSVYNTDAKVAKALLGKLGVVTKTKQSNGKTKGYNVVSIAAQSLQPSI